MSFAVFRGHPSVKYRPPLGRYGTTPRPECATRMRASPASQPMLTLLPRKRTW